MFPGFFPGLRALSGMHSLLTSCSVIHSQDTLWQGVLSGVVQARDVDSVVVVRLDDGAGLGVAVAAPEEVGG